MIGESHSFHFPPHFWKLSIFRYLKRSVFVFIFSNMAMANILTPFLIICGQCSACHYLSQSECPADAPSFDSKVSPVVRCQEEGAWVTSCDACTDPGEFIGHSHSL